MTKSNKILFLLLIIGNIILWPTIISQLNLNSTEANTSETESTSEKSDYDRLMSNLMDNKVSEVKKIIEEGSVDLTHMNEYGDKPILWAAHYSPESVPLLLAEGVDPNFTNQGEDTEEITPISIAAANDGWRPKHYDAAVSLLEHGADPTSPNIHGITPLMAAAKFDGTKEMVQLLLDHGANPLCTDMRGETAKDKAISVRRDDRKEIIELLDREMKSGKYSLEDCENWNIAGKSPEEILKSLDYTLGKDEFKYAITTNDTYAVKQFLALGYNPNITRDTGNSILHELYWSEQYRMIELLVEGGAQPDMGADNMGMTPLMRLAEDGHVDLVETLLKHGADPTLENNAGWNAIRFARAEGHYDVLEVIEQYRQKKEQVSHEEFPPEFTVTVHENVKKRFYDRDKAIAYAKQYEQAEVYTPNVPIWDNKPSSVYQGEKHIGDFPTIQQGIDVANQYKNAKVINRKTDYVVFDNFPKQCGTCDSPIQDQYRE
ncbi:ankyrin repeat domain-containing protein [Pontibacillus marinus]|uniref:Uncharacterized protein n=1 Tax=Pontibacillus marinus BH030004 = DSM 16465 TaxID=1385511 RepID=A0A0A5GL04_9BACI|nr:ankyrin repeat domain-containing protein [Pontibacillus marinus]KGX91898.1 hypothetical protein N783_00800 [Pontibacillus marinus BH030004 = DSM 16465]